VVFSLDRKIIYCSVCSSKGWIIARCWWVMPVVLATQEAEIRRISVCSQPRQTVCKTLSQKNPSQNRAGGVTKG
jgi:hypothetical protein